MTNSTHTADLNEEELLLQAFDEAKYIEQSVTDLSLAEQVREVKKRYDRKSLLGEGALKKVYLAYDELLDRDVALAKMKEEGLPPKCLGLSNFKYSYWTPAQMVAHHTVNGCNLRAGDLFGSGTISGPGADQTGALIELTQGGKLPIQQHTQYSTSGVIL